MGVRKKLFAVVSSLLMVMTLSGAGGRGPAQKGSNATVVGSEEAAGVMAPASADEALFFEAESEFDPHWSSVGVYSNAQVCAGCHKASTDGSGVMRMPKVADGEDISPSARWRHSMMAQAWSDPYFQATVEEQASEFPSYAGDIEDKCLTCHSPMAHSNAHDTGLGLSTADCSLGTACYRLETAQQDDHAREGVSCTLCHQMVDDGQDVIGSGSYLVPGEDDAAAKTIYGPYLNPLTRPMENNTQYTPEHSSYISSSEHCASCHDLSTPTFDVNTGHPAQPAAVFREQAAYAEWLNSRYGDGNADDQSCQDCHMQSPEGYATQIAVTRSGAANGNWPTRAPYSLHSLTGGNTYVLGLLKTWRAELGIEQSTSEQGFEKAIADTRAFLQQAADISLSCQSDDEVALNLCVTITNRTGHKLPTGYPSRRMWVQLTVTDPTGNLVFESGRPDERGYLAADQKYLDQSCLDIEKPDGFDSAGCYERHLDVITRPDQVAIFESVMADTNSDITYSLLYGAGYLKDNRIPPEGFSTLGSNYDETTSVAGEALLDQDFNRSGTIQGTGSDTVHYQITIPEKLRRQRGQYFVQARLWYQSIRPAFVNAMPHGGDKALRMQTMYQEQPPLPELLGMDTMTIE